MHELLIAFIIFIIFFILIAIAIGYAQNRATQIKTDTGRYIFSTLLTLLVLTIIGFMLWRYLFSHNGGLTGHPCFVDSDCAENHYCGGSNLCVPGVSGGKEGAICMNSSNCEVGFKCKGTQENGNTVLRCTKNILF